jgi:hypothetical protein
VAEHRLELFREITLGNVRNQTVFPDPPPAGHSSCYVICNGVPGSDPGVLVQLIKALGGHADLGYRTDSASVHGMRSNGGRDDQRAVPTPLWASALKPGYFCASHTEYCPHLEQYFLQRKQHKMLFLVRDPRDIAVMRTPKREAGRAARLDDASHIASSILALPGSGIQNFMSWLDSPACLTVRFETLVAELSEADPSAASFPVLDGICDYLGLPRQSPSELAISRGLLSPEITRQIGGYRSRMTPDHIDLLRSEPFQRLVVEFGYEPTPPGEQRYRSARRALVQMIRRSLTAVRDGLHASPARPAH